MGKHSMRRLAFRALATRHSLPPGLLPRVVFTSLFLLVTCHSSLVTVLHAQGGGPPGGEVNALAIDPSNPATLYAGTERGGVFKSTNGGSSWTAVNSGLTITFVPALA